MMKLNELPNIGSELAKRIESAGFETVESLKEAGSRQVFLALNEMDPTVCINTLYALEGAVRSIRWHSLPREDKLDLNEFYKLVKSSPRVR
ncbi:MAG: TfoX/Sxy family DNA transformation protein [Bacteroidales bacterium]|nr:TfoX/Sxy family DNA transformation protein [Bacteroidales bacterium]